MQKDFFPTLARTWIDNPQEFWLASVLTFRRNLEPFRFSSTLSSQEKLQIIHLLSQIMKRSEKTGIMNCIPAENATPWQKDFLIETFLIMESIHQGHVGDSFFFDMESMFLIIANIYDHLLLKHSAPGGNLGQNLDDLISFENCLCQHLSFAFSEEFGFLTKDPRLCGTGLVVQAFLMLPKIFLGKQLGALLKNKQFKGIKVKMLGCGILVLENKNTFGISEEQIITEIETAVQHLIAIERNINRINHPELILSFEDKIYRTLGLLRHARCISEEETVSSMGLLKLGLHMDILSGLSQEKLNQLIFSARKAHISYGNNPHQNIEKDRADFIRSAIQQISSPAE